MDKWNNHQYRGLLSKQQFIADNCIHLLHHATLSPDLIPCDFYLLPEIKFRRSRVYKNYLNSSVAFVVLNSGITEGVYCYREKNA